jgi:hypothetical protein
MTRTLTGSAMTLNQFTLFKSSSGVLNFVRRKWLVDAHCQIDRETVHQADPLLAHSDFID